MAEQEPKGPVMLCVTKVLKPPPTRVGKIGNNLTFARTVPLASLIGGSVGAFVGIVLFGALLGFTINSIVWGGAAGCGIVLFLLNYQPIAGESFAKWLGLNVLHMTRGTVPYKGRRVRMSIGMARISRVARGRVRMRPAAVEVDPTQFDSRGVLISEKNLNVDTAPASAITPADVAVGAAPVRYLSEPAGDAVGRVKRRRGRDSVDPAPPIHRPDRPAADQTGPQIVRPDIDGR